MELTDIASIKKWQDLENDICKRSGLNASVFDMDGNRISESENYVNQLCPQIKSHSKGQTFICSLAHQNICSMTEKSKKPVIEECDAGLVKMAVPIFINDEMVGVVGGCGLVLPEGEVDTFLIQKTIGGDEDALIELADKIGSITEESLIEITDYIANRIEQLISAKSSELPV